MKDDKFGDFLKNHFEDVKSFEKSNIFQNFFSSKYSENLEISLFSNI